MATEEWRALKKVWQEITRHATEQVGDGKAFLRLEPPMRKAFAGLKKQATALEIEPKIIEALQAAVEQRYGHILWSVYPPATCYELSILGGQVQDSQDRLEKQYATVVRLAQQERIKPEVADKARQLIARQIEFQAQAEPLLKERPDNRPEQQEDELSKSCTLTTGEVKPDFPVSETSQQVARLILELCRP
jgi:hypothetical protein